MAVPKRFEDFTELSAETLSVLQHLGFTTPTPVQEATIPLFCGNKDVAVDACTGSGKTLAFILPFIEKLRRLGDPLRKHQVGALVISPTRELAKQIWSVAQPFVASVPNLTSLLLVGGNNPTQDVSHFRETGGHVIIGTPGRIHDIMKRCNFLDVKRLEVLVLDEADRLLDMGFRAQLDGIMEQLPKQRRTGLFSATQTEAVQSLARAGLRNPIRVNVTVTINPKSSSHSKKRGADGSVAANNTSSTAVDTQKTPSSLRLHYLVCEAHGKLPQLVQFLQDQRSAKVIVYFLTCASVDFHRTVLPQLPQLKGVSFHWLHGHMKQAAREMTLTSFAAANAGCLLCTDVAARGLDIPDVTWIVQFDPPQDPDAFVHRVGRTARMGRSGSAIVYLMNHENSYVDFLKLRKVPLVPQAPHPSPPDVLPEVQHLSESQREVMERGTKAFVSHVRGYKEHHCSFIFRLSDLDLAALAKAYALLRLPKMPEVRKSTSLQKFIPSPVDPDTVKYKDKSREKQRRKLLKQQQHASRAASTVLNVQPNKAKQDVSAKHLPAAKRRLMQTRQDQADFEEDYRLLKKVKKGKISEEEFDRATGIAGGDISDSDEEEGGAGQAQGRKRSNGFKAPGVGGKHKTHKFIAKGKGNKKRR